MVAFRSLLILNTAIFEKVDFYDNMRQFVMIMMLLIIMMLKMAVWMDNYVFEDDDEEKCLALDSGQSIIGPVVIMMILDSAVVNGREEK